MKRGDIVDLRWRWVYNIKWCFVDDDKLWRNRL